MTKIHNLKIIDSLLIIILLISFFGQKFIV